MKLYRLFIEALESLNANKLRSMLTVLGIVIGVAAVIAMLSIGRGAEASITSRIESMGTNLIYVTPGSTSESGVQSSAGSAGTLTLDDSEALASLPDVVDVAALTNNMVQVVYQGQNTRTRLVGVTPSYETVGSLTLEDGEFISEDDQNARSLVVVLGNSVAEDLFGSTAGVVGQRVRLNGQPYKVIGVLASKGGTGFMNQDDQVFIPLSTALYRLVGNSQFRGSSVIGQITVKASSTDAIDQVVNEVMLTMRELHGTVEGADDFTVTSQQATLDAATEVADTMTIFLGGIAGISLAVGGIGIMNIMLTTVTERTHEIGLRKAVGAKRQDILLQFLVESVVLSLAGGLIGVALGWSTARLMGQVQFSGSTITPVVGLDSVLLATLFSMAVGLFFGIYPATRAARLQPVEALRYE
ncbi:MAG TPA: ABC transporter permease [Anaerolineales bacterium]|nr:ABC transporter permease [Anaerolineales bacterium]